LPLDSHIEKVYISSKIILGVSFAPSSQHFVGSGKSV